MSRWFLKHENRDVLLESFGCFAKIACSSGDKKNGIVSVKLAENERRHRARTFFASLTEFLCGSANSDKQSTIFRFGGVHLPSTELRWGELRGMIVKALSFYGEQSQRLADGRFILYQGSDRSHFLSISRRLVIHSRTRTCSGMLFSFNEIAV